MRSLLSLCLVGAGFGQTCAHQVTRSPIGPVLPYQNGKLLGAGDFSYTTSPGAFPSISPALFSIGDRMTVTFTRQVPLSFTYQGVKVPYIGYALWREDWVCTQGNTAPASRLTGLKSCSGSGPSPQNPLNPWWDPLAGYGVGSVVNFGAFSWFSLRAGNTGQFPDASPDWWKVISWDCGGLWAAIIVLSDGSSLPLVGTSYILGDPAPGIVWSDR